MAPSQSQIPTDIMGEFHQEYQQDDELRGFFHHRPASEPVNDYITEFDVRCKLFAEFQEIAGASRLPYTLDAAMFAVVMVAPVSKMEDFLRVLKANRCHWAHCLLMATSRVAEVIRCYAPGPLRVSLDEDDDSESELPYAPRAERNTFAFELCKERDQNACIFTGSRDPENAYILPSRAFYDEYTYMSLRSLFETFWGYEQVINWPNPHGHRTGMPDVPRNLLSLSLQLQLWWHSSKFALKPLRKKEGGIVVQWHWLKASALEPTQQIPIGTNLSELVDPQGWGDDSEGLAAHHKSGRKIKTGHIFIIRAENPEHLPSFELLELQWNLSRIAAISGAAWVMDDSFSRALRERLLELRCASPDREFEN